MPESIKAISPFKAMKQVSRSLETIIAFRKSDARAAQEENIEKTQNISKINVKNKDKGPVSTVAVAGIIFATGALVSYFSKEIFQIFDNLHMGFFDILGIKPESARKSNEDKGAKLDLADANITIKSEVPTPTESDDFVPITTELNDVKSEMDEIDKEHLGFFNSIREFFGFKIPKPGSTPATPAATSYRGPQGDTEMAPGDHLRTKEHHDAPKNSLSDPGPAAGAEPPDDSNNGKGGGRGRRSVHRKVLASSNSEASSADSAGSPIGSSNPRDQDNADEITDEDNTTFGSTSGATGTPGPVSSQSDLPGAQGATGTPGPVSSQSDLPGPQKEFYNKMYKTLLEQATKEGVKDPEAIARLGAAQSSIETGYGKHTAGGNNYFGIKDFSGKGGNKQTTQEWDAKQGKMITIQDSFRKYNSMEESAGDYIKFLKQNSRYIGVLNAGSTKEAIAAQGKTGYATDPNYANKLAWVHSAANEKQVVNIADAVAAGQRREPPNLATAAVPPEDPPVAPKIVVTTIGQRDATQDVSSSAVPAVVKLIARNPIAAAGAVKHDIHSKTLQKRRLRRGYGSP